MVVLQKNCSFFLSLTSSLFRWKTLSLSLLWSTFPNKLQQTRPREEMSGPSRPGCLATRHSRQSQRGAQCGLQIMSDLPPPPPLPLITSTLPWRVFSSLVFWKMPIKSFTKNNPVRDLVLNLIIRVDINNFCQTSKFASMDLVLWNFVSKCLNGFVRQKSFFYN